MGKQANTRSGLAVIAGWAECFKIVAIDEGSGLSIRAQAHVNGPQLLHNPQRIPAVEIHDAIRVMHWLPMALHHVLFVALDDALSDTPILVTGRWPRFKALCEFHMNIPWGDLVERAVTYGSDDVADMVAGTLFTESGLEEALASIVLGKSPLRLVPQTPEHV